MVELVPFSETLRKIQVEYGVTGSFKDKPLAEWLRKYNPAEDEYDKVNTHTKGRGFDFISCPILFLYRSCHFLLHSAGNDLKTSAPLSF